MAPTLVDHLDIRHVPLQRDILSQCHRAYPFIRLGDSIGIHRSDCDDTPQHCRCLLRFPFIALAQKEQRQMWNFEDQNTDMFAASPSPTTSSSELTGSLS
jgi:hypothetical protein